MPPVLQPFSLLACTLAWGFGACRTWGPLAGHGSWGGGWAEELYPSCPCSEGKARDRDRATLRACPFPLL